jgi:methionyl aminopeptidase
MNGFHADSAYTFAIGNVKEATIKLMQVTKVSLSAWYRESCGRKSVGIVHLPYRNTASASTALDV